MVSVEDFSLAFCPSGLSSVSSTEPLESSADVSPDFASEDSSAFSAVGVESSSGLVASWFSVALSGVDSA